MPCCSTAMQNMLEQKFYFSEIRAGKDLRFKGLCQIGSREAVRALWTTSCFFASKRAISQMHWGLSPREEPRHDFVPCSSTAMQNMLEKNFYFSEIRAEKKLRFTGLCKTCSL